MKLHLTTAIAIIVLAFTQLGFSQSPPGYLGKKTTLGIGFGIIPSIQGPDSKNRGPYSDDFELAEKIGRDNLLTLEMTRTVARHGSVSLLYSKSTTGVNSNFNSVRVLDDGTVTSEELRYNGFLLADISTLGIVYNFFKGKNGYLAPLGNTFSIGIKKNYIKASFQLPDEDDIDDPFDIVDLNPKFNFNSILLGWSRTMIIQDLIYIKPRLTFATSFKGLINRNNYFFEGQDDFEEDFIERLLLHEVVQFDISAGIIF